MTFVTSRLVFAIPAYMVLVIHITSNEKKELLVSNKFCDMCGDTNDSVGFSGCAHPEHADIMICDLCDIDGSLYNGWCHEAGEEGVDPSVGDSIIKNEEGEI